MRLLTALLAISIATSVLTPGAPLLAQVQEVSPSDAADEECREEENIEDWFSLGGLRYALVREQWRRCVHNFESRKYAEFLVDLSNLMARKIDSGAKNLTPISRVLLRMAVEASRDSDPVARKVAGDIITMARRFSPDLPEPFQAAPRVGSDSGALTLAATLDNYGDYIVSQARTLPRLHQLVNKLVFIVLVISLAILILFSLFLMVRHTGFLAHDLSHFMPRGANQLQMVILVVLALALPLLLDLGLVIMILSWWLVFWMYMNAYERGAAFILLIGVGLLPLLFGFFLSTLPDPDGLSATLARCNHEVCSPYDLERLRSDPDQDPRSVFTTALVDYQTAAFDQNMLDQSLAQVKSLLTRQDLGGLNLTANLQVLLGNIRYTKGVRLCASQSPNRGMPDFEEATLAYDAALAKDPGNVEALYNKGRLLYFFGQPGEGDLLIARARQLGTSRVLEFEESTRFSGRQENLCDSEFNHNRELMAPRLKVRDLFVTLFRKSHSEQLPILQQQLLGPLTTSSVPVLAGIALFVMILLSIAGRRVRVSSGCIRCGEVSCARCRSEASDMGLCDTCLYYRVRGSFVDPKEVWRRDKKVESGLRSRRRIARALCFIGPGLGQFYKGSPIRGILFLTFFWGPLLSILISEPLLPGIPGLSRDLGVPMMQTIMLCVLSVMAYFLSLVDIYSRD